MKPITTLKQAVQLPEGLYDYEIRETPEGTYRIPRKLALKTDPVTKNSITEFIDLDGKRKQVVLTVQGFRKVTV